MTDTTYTNNDRGLPIYWVGGGRVADDYADFYDGDWENETRATDGSGDALSLSVGPWTGSASDGTELVEDGVSRAVGESRVGYGAPGADPLHSSFTAANTEMRPLYVLMPPFEVGFPLLVSNFKQRGRSESDLSARRSQRFATGANLHGYELRQVNIDYFDEQGDPFSVDLYTVNPAGQPDTLIETLDPPADFYRGNINHVFHPPGNTVLAANTTYALVVRPDSQGTDLGLGVTR